ncbi:expressed unknown protein [Seminavis robusta]|uniref:Uncharacterized protein n=1 Tax=Seminavis robusta TaxID=568900 RepID=A0A9N8D4G2_9STRA|nr:expressed unknown protein [Seminavis robusta]|eukprot:Sro3_g002370.1 n/a (392) ;mRNA; f:132411-133586
MNVNVVTRNTNPELAIDFSSSLKEKLKVNSKNKSINRSNTARVVPAAMKLFNQFLPYHLKAQQQPMLLSTVSTSTTSTVSTSTTSSTSTSPTKMKMKMNSKKKKHLRKIHKFLLSDNRDAYQRFCQPTSTSTSTSTNTNTNTNTKRKCNCKKEELEKEKQPEDMTNSTLDLELSFSSDSSEADLPETIDPIEPMEVCLCNWDSEEFEEFEQEEEEEDEDTESISGSDADADAEDHLDQQPFDCRQDEPEEAAPCTTTTTTTTTRRQQHPQYHSRPTVRLNLTRRSNWKFVTDKQELQAWKEQKEWLAQDKMALKNRRQTLRTLRRTSFLLRLPMRRGFVEWNESTRNNLIFSVIPELQDEYQVEHQDEMMDAREVDVDELELEMERMLEQQ